MRVDEGINPYRLRLRKPHIVGQGLAPAEKLCQFDTAFFVSTFHICYKYYFFVKSAVFLG